MNNLALRTVSGVGFGAVMLACLLLDKFLFAVLVLFIMSAMMAEFFKMTMGESYKLQRILAIVAGCILFLLLFAYCAFGLPVRFVSLAIIPVIVVMVSSLYVKDRTEFGKFTDIYTGLLYIAVPLSLSNLIAFHDGSFNTMLLLCFFIIIWSSDIGAYVLGTAFGQKHGKKLFPEISPKKSWIGFWGGLFFAILASCIMRWTGLFEYPLIHCIILAVLMNVAGVYGDLFESQWKRSYGFKDSGNIIPGHGGMLDRFDSSLFAIPVGAIYLALTNLL